MMTRLKQILCNPYVVAGTLIFIACVHYIADLFIEKSYRSGFYPLPLEIIMFSIFIGMVFYGLKAEPSNKYEAFMQKMMVILTYIVFIIGMIEFYYRFQ